MKVGWPGSGSKWVIREQATSGYKREMGRNGSSAGHSQPAGIGDLELELIYAEKLLHMYVILPKQKW